MRITTSCLIVACSSWIGSESSFAGEVTEGRISKLADEISQLATRLKPLSQEKGLFSSDASPDPIDRLVQRIERQARIVKVHARRANHPEMATCLAKVSRDLEEDTENLRDDMRRMANRSGAKKQGKGSNEGARLMHLTIKLEMAARQLRKELGGPTSATVSGTKRSRS